MQDSKKNYKVIHEGGASISQMVDGKLDQRNVSQGVVIALDPDAEQTQLMLENKTIAEVNSPEAQAVPDAVAGGATTMQNGILTEKDGTPSPDGAKDNEQAPTSAAASTGADASGTSASADETEADKADVNKDADFNDDEANVDAEKGADENAADEADKEAGADASGTSADEQQAAE